MISDWFSGIRDEWLHYREREYRQGHALTPQENAQRQVDAALGEQAQNALDSVPPGHKIFVTGLPPGGCNGHAGISIPDTMPTLEEPRIGEWNYEAPRRASYRRGPSSTQGPGPAGW